MRLASLLAIFLMMIGNVWSQPLPDGVEANMQYGKIYKHTRRFLPEVEKPSYAIELNLFQKTDTTKKWRHTFRQPQTGLAMSVRRFGNDNILGYGYGIMPFIHLPLWRTRSGFELQVRLASGVAFLPRHYDIVENPNNNVIACLVNNISSFGLRAQWRFTKYSVFSSSATFTHYSTGDARLPNLGINVPALSVGYLHYFHPHPIIPPGKTGKQDTYPALHVIKRIKATTARFEAFRPNGPLYLQTNVELAIGKNLSNWNKLFIAADVYQNSFAYHYIIHQELEPLAKAFIKSTGSSIMLEDQFEFGKVSLLVAWAYVIRQPYLRGGNDYQRVGAQYRFYTSSNKLKKAFWGIYLKTHWANAELVATGFGFEW